MSDKVVIIGVETYKYNPFNATAEELIAHSLDENALINEYTLINGKPARNYCASYLDKCLKYREATRIGELLIRAKVINYDELHYALELQKETPIPLGEILVSKGLCTEDIIEKALEQQSSIREDFEEINSFKQKKESIWQKVINFFSI